MSTNNEKKKITVLLGNGFDLSCGLHSRYTDVYNEYIKAPSESEIVDSFKKELTDHKEWSDYEWAMRNYMAKFIQEKDLLECHRSFRDYMHEYLQKEEKWFENEIQWKTVLEEIKRETSRSLRSIKKHLDIDSAVEWRFLCFNYTNVADKVFSGKKVIHVNGDLSDSIVMGIDNRWQIPTDLGYDISEELDYAFVKTEFNEKYYKRRVDEGKTLIEDSDYICTFGFSLGYTDKNVVGMP